MPLTSDTFIERSLLKRQVTFWRLAAVGVMVFFLIILVERNAKIPKVAAAKDAYIARVTVQGVVGDDQKLYKLLDEIRDNNDIKAVILHLDTQGGVAVGGETIYRKIKEITEVKPVVASMRSICASAGYMISLAADHVLAMRSTITGSIGVIIQTAELSELAEKLGITPITVKSGAYKGSPSMTDPITEDERIVVQQMIDEFHTVFVEMVAEARELPIEDVRNIADGRVYSAMRALELGLIDALGGEAEALAWLEEHKDIPATMEVRDMQLKSRFDTIMDRLSQTAGLEHLTGSHGLHQGLMLIWQPAL